MARKASSIATLTMPVNHSKAITQDWLDSRRKYSSANGLNLETAADALKEMFDCPICRCPVTNPVQTSCGHLFCNMCLEGLFSNPPASCPLCKEKITNRGLILREDVGDLQKVFAKFTSTLHEELQKYQNKENSKTKTVKGRKNKVPLQIIRTPKKKEMDSSREKETGNAALTPTKSNLRRQSGKEVDSGAVKLDGRVRKERKAVTPKTKPGFLKNPEYLILTTSAIPVTTTATNFENSDGKPLDLSVSSQSNTRYLTTAAIKFIKPLDLSMRKVKRKFETPPPPPPAPSTSAKAGKDLVDTPNDRTKRGRFDEVAGPSTKKNDVLIEDPFFGFDDDDDDEIFVEMANQMLQETNGALHKKLPIAPIDVNDEVSQEKDGALALIKKLPVAPVDVINEMSQETDALNTKLLVVSADANNENEMFLLGENDGDDWSEQKRYVFCPTRLNKIQLQQLQELCKVCNGTIAKDYNEDVTHLIIQLESGRIAQTLKYLLAIAGRKWVVIFDWVEKCLEKNAMVQEAEFETSNFKQCDSGVNRSRLSKSNLFEGFNFYFASDYYKQMLGITTDEVNMLMKILGAKVLSSIENFCGPLLIVGNPNERDTEYYSWLHTKNWITLTFQWIIDCILKYQLQHVQDYLCVSINEDDLQSANVPKRLKATLSQELYMQ